MFDEYREVRRSDGPRAEKLTDLSLELERPPTTSRVAKIEAACEALEFGSRLP